MRTKVLNYSIPFLLAFLVQMSSFAQNPFWTLPDQYLFFEAFPPQPLPAPIPYQLDLNYNSEVAHHAHNAIAKPNGELAFFVIDDRVYDKDGYVMYIFGHGFYNPKNVSGNSEICIVPDPASCGARFYIFTSNSAIDGAFYYPYGTILDLEAPSVGSVNPESSLGGPAFGGFDYDNIKKMNELAAFENTQGGLENFNNNHDHPYIFAASPKLEDNSHLVIFSDGSSIHRMRIDEAGMHPINPPLIIGNIVPGYGSNNNGEKSELELIQINSSTFRIGISTTASGSGSVVGAFDVDLNGNYNGGTAFAHSLLEPSSDKPHIKGLEFSKNGRYLYFTHHVSPNNPDAVRYLDLDLSTVNTLNVPNNGDFQYSQIELGIDDRLYFAYANGLATLANSDDPNSTWTPLAISQNQNLSNSGFPGEEDKYSYLLPDQIDGMDYSQIFAYPEYVVTVSGTDTWTPTNNPNIQ